MKIAMIVLAVLVGVVVLVAAIGWMLPVKHVATRQATYRATPEAVFATITDVERLPTWRASVKSVEMDTSQSKRTRFRETGSDGTIAYVVEERVPPRRLVTRIDDGSLPFGGSWTYELTPAGDSTTLRITENGEVYNPIFRFMSKFVFSHHRTIETYLTELGGKLGSAATIEP